MPVTTSSSTSSTSSTSTSSAPSAATTPAAATGFAVVRTRQGQVRGRVVDGIHSFRGVPYAAPPFGRNRLRAPQPPEPWSGVRDALEEGHKPPQAVAAQVARAMGPAPWDRAPAGEDCLNLDIWTREPGGARMPVMIWVPGGMFEVCSAAWYDGSRFARDGVVCVAINYRVGAEGFLSLEDAVPNRGLLDQIAALEWVHDNIAAFGGDPDNVTLCGESAGAMSIGTLLGVPRADALFRRAIAQSGAAHQVLPATTARRMGHLLAERLGVAPTTEAMAAVPVEQMLAAQTALKEEMLARPDPDRWSLDVVASLLLWQPVVDGDVLPTAPLKRVHAGARADVDVMVGSNTDDWRLFRALDGHIQGITEDILTGPIATHGYLSAAAYGLPLERALPAYRQANPSASPGELLAAIQTDWWCRIPAIRLAEAHVNDLGRTYMYEFAWPSPVADGLFGACHALEVPFVFDTLDERAQIMLGELLGDHPPQELATAMHAAWVSFVASGDPGWPRYDLQRRATMRFDAVSRVVDDPRARERALWAGVR